MNEHENASGQLNEREIRELVGEIVVAGFASPEIDAQAERLIAHHRVKNIILFSRNVVSMEQVKTLTDSLQSFSKNHGHDAPLLICTDQENGIVRRIAPDLPGLPGNMAVGATLHPEVAYEIGKATAEQLLAAGINMNLAPDLDVNNNAENPVIGVRSYGDDAKVVAQFGVAMMKGLQDHGVVACGKHFPGHGDTSVDSHMDVPLIGHERVRLDEVELVPFRAAIEAGIDTIMTAHVVFPAVESRKGIVATLSQAVLTALLREELGFQGVITTDCLEMNAISETLGVGPGAVQALLAGADMLMISHQLTRQEDAIESLVRAVLAGDIPLKRLQEAAGRVRALRDKRIGSGTGPTATKMKSTPLSEVFAKAEALQSEVCQQAVTVVANDTRVIPLSPNEVQSIAVVLNSNVPFNVAAGHVDTKSPLPKALEKAYPGATVQVLGVGTESNPAETVQSARQADLVVVGVHGVGNQAFRRVVQDLITSGHPRVVVIALQSPYDLAAFPEASTAICLYEHTPWMVQAAVTALRDGNASGKLPVTIAPGWERGHHA